MLRNLMMLYTMETMRYLAFLLAVCAVFSPSMRASNMEGKVECGLSLEPVRENAPSLPPRITGLSVPAPGQEQNFLVNLLCNTPAPFRLDMEARRVAGIPRFVYQVEVTGQRFLISPVQDLPPRRLWSQAWNRNTSLLLRLRRLPGPSETGYWEYPLVFSVWME